MEPMTNRNKTMLRVAAEIVEQYMKLCQCENQRHIKPIQHQCFYINVEQISYIVLKLSFFHLVFDNYSPVISVKSSITKYEKQCRS